MLNVHFIQAQSRTNVIRVFSLNRGVTESLTRTSTYTKSSGNKIYILPQTPAKQHSSGKGLSKGLEPVPIEFSFHCQIAKHTSDCA